MKYIFKIILASVFISIISLNSFGQTYIKQDSILASKNAFDFFNWYLNSIRQNHHNAYQPKFAAASNGMTTLDFSTYEKNLAIHHFTDSLIQAEKKSYKNCITNLEKTLYTEFEKYTDLDQFETINCDYSNSYKWFHSMEMPDTITIKSIKFNNKETAVVTLSIGNYLSEEKTYSYFGFILVTMKRINNTWKIANIQ